MRDWLPVLATLLIIVIGKSVAAYAIVRLFRHSHATALTISASLAQIGEFSFILAGLGVSLKLLPEQGRDLILAGAHPVDRAQPAAVRAARSHAGKGWRDGRAPPQAASSRGAAREPLPVTTLTGHVVLVGHGRVGSYISEALGKTGVPLLVIDSETRNTRPGARAAASRRSSAMPPIRR